MQFAAVNKAYFIEDGFQVGLINITDDYLAGFTLGVVNVTNKVKGWQFGLINWTEHLEGTQVGLLNFSKDGFMILLNWSDRDSESDDD